MRRRPHVLAPGGPIAFPDPNDADDDGLVAIGGDLSPQRLLLAYESGIFPWYDAGLPPLWWSPNPRAVIDPRSLHVSRSMRRAMRGEYELRFDTAFRTVMLECAERRHEGTWILPEMVEAYVRLFELGRAHSVEVWMRGQLVGGLYGVQCGGLFAAESMFHRRTNASKLALIAAVRKFFALGVELFDVQFMTSHLASMGVHEVPRAHYLERLAHARSVRVDLTNLSMTDASRLAW
jgi:leucyl/phenylalanyl-tRNA--protein transferase